jgi:hypothetical protein
MTTVISLLAPGAKKPGYATNSSVCLKKLRKTMVILSQDNQYWNRFQIHNLQKKSHGRSDATSSEVNNGYIQSFYTGARSDFQPQKTHPMLREQVLRAKTADSGF